MAWNLGLSLWDGGRRETKFCGMGLDSVEEPDCVDWVFEVIGSDRIGR